MRIAPLPPVMQQALLAATLPAVDRAFATVARTADVVTPPAVLPPPPQAATSVQMLIAMAAATPASEERRRIAAETERGLSMLERLHAELAGGVAAPERLEELAAWSESFEAPDDPQLAGLAREVELRVRVEIAKHEMRA